MERLNDDEQRRLKDAMKNMSAAWTDLNDIMKIKSRRLPVAASCNDDDCSKLRCDQAECWHKAMANSILSLETRADYSAPDTYLVLLCFNAIFQSL